MSGQLRLIAQVDKTGIKAGLLGREAFFIGYLQASIGIEGDRKRGPSQFLNLRLP